MFPMDYEEFKWALGDTVTIPLLQQLFTERKAAGQASHRLLMRDYRLYMLIGGMPQAVMSYIETNDFRKVDQVKRDILSLYEADLRKIDPSGKLSSLFDAIPAQLMGNASRYQVSSVLSGSRAVWQQTKILKDLNCSPVIQAYLRRWLLKTKTLRIMTYMYGF